MSSLSFNELIVDRGAVLRSAPKLARIIQTTWSWLVPVEVEPFLVTAWGDVFIAHGEGVSLLDTCQAELTAIPLPREALTSEDECDQLMANWYAWITEANVPGVRPALAEAFEQWFRPSLVVEFNARGMKRAPTHCFSPALPPFVGGPWRELGNWQTMAPMLHLETAGSMARELPVAANTFGALAADVFPRFQAKQAALPPPDPAGSWSASQDTGELLRTNAKGKVTMRARFQFLGSYSERTKLWVWGWANPSVDAALVSSLDEVRAFGEARKVPELTTGRMPASDDGVSARLAVAVELIEAQAMYAGAINATTMGFYALFDIEDLT